MIVVTTPYVSGYRVSEVKGEVFGLVVRSRGLADYMSEIVAYGTAVVLVADAEGGKPVAE